MLSGFVNQHYTDKDFHLHYVMMAYRSEQHETMGVIAKCVNAEIDNIRWVWELQERLENAYPFV